MLKPKSIRYNAKAEKPPDLQTINRFATQRTANFDLGKLATLEGPHHFMKQSIHFWSETEIGSKVLYLRGNNGRQYIFEVLKRGESDIDSEIDSTSQAYIKISPAAKESFHPTTRDYYTVELSSLSHEGKTFEQMIVTIGDGPNQDYFLLEVERRKNNKIDAISITPLPDWETLTSRFDFLDKILDLQRFMGVNTDWKQTNFDESNLKAYSLIDKFPMQTVLAKDLMMVIKTLIDLENHLKLVAFSNQAAAPENEKELHADSDYQAQDTRQGLVAQIDFLIACLYQKFYQNFNFFHRVILQVPEASSLEGVEHPKNLSSEDLSARILSLQRTFQLVRSKDTVFKDIRLPYTKFREIVLGRIELLNAFQNLDSVFGVSYRMRRRYIEAEVDGHSESARIYEVQLIGPQAEKVYMEMRASHWVEIEIDGLENHQYNVVNEHDGQEYFTANQHTPTAAVEFNDEVMVNPQKVWNVIGKKARKTGSFRALKEILEKEGLAGEQGETAKFPNCILVFSLNPRVVKLNHDR